MGRIAKAVWSFLGFAVRLTAVHILTYMVIGGISYWLIARKYWVGPARVPGLNDPTGDFVQRWLLPAQILRGFIYAVALYPLRRALLGMGRWGGLVVASLMLLVGSIAGISGFIESCVYMADPHVALFLVHLPEVVIQSLLFGYLLLWWERRYALSVPVAAA
jgi:hypothetical protein